MRWAFVILACGAACYGPPYRDCDVSCASGAGCPSGLTCDPVSLRCRTANATEACTSSGDDGGNPIGDGSASCWYGVAPSNFAPCDPAFPPAIPSFTFLNGEVFDTDTGMLQASGGSAPGKRYSFDGHDMWLIHFASWSLPAGTQLNTVGETPLLIVSDGDITIDGSINALPGVRTGCGMLDGASDGFAGGGAGGGGHGDDGGAGGVPGGDVVGGTAGGAARGTASLIPLTTGCAGGGGGQGGATTHGGRVGLGGGAFELAAQARIHITGRLLANGGGGGGGNASTAASLDCSGVACAGGGGGGGAGGAILVEAQQVDTTATAAICAGGGGGGEGGDAAMVGPPHDGVDGSCMGGAGGASARAGGDGGGGGALGSATAGQGGAVGSPPSGGGGGGGAPGRIRIHAIAKSVAATVAPAPAP